MIVEEGQVILVDAFDTPTGTLGKMEAHLQGVLHRAFSVIVFDKYEHLILQQRSSEKYHSPGLWTNTCCSHPKPGEGIEAAAHRRLKEEMGFDAQLKKVFDFIYRHEFENGLVEHEYDHVFVGKFSGKVNPNPTEVSAWKAVSLDQLKRDVIENSEQYTVWFKIILENFLKKLRKD